MNTCILAESIIITANDGSLIIKEIEFLPTAVIG